MPGPSAPAGSSEYTFLQDLRDALLPFIAAEHSDNLQLHLDLVYGLTNLANKLDAVNATLQLLNLQGQTDSAALLAKLEQIRVKLAVPHPW